MNQFFSEINHRHTITKYFITFPQTEISPQYFISKISNLGIHHSITAQETHQDGNHHLHSIIFFYDKISKPSILRVLKAHFPEDYMRIHVRSLKSYEKAKQYLYKEDHNPYTTGSGPISASLLQSYTRFYQRWYENEMQCLCMSIGFPEEFNRCPGCQRTHNRGLHEPQ